MQFVNNFNGCEISDTGQVLTTSEHFARLPKNTQKKKQILNIKKHRVTNSGFKPGINKKNETPIYYYFRATLKNAKMSYSLMLILPMFTSYNIQQLQ